MTAKRTHKGNGSKGYRGRKGNSAGAAMGKGKQYIQARVSDSVAPALIQAQEVAIEQPAVAVSQTPAEDAPEPVVLDTAGVLAEEPPTASTSILPATASAEVQAPVVVRKKKRWTFGRVTRWTAGLAGVVLLLGLGWGVYLLVRLQTLIYKPLPPTPTAVVQVVMPAPTVARGQGTQVAVVLPSPTPDRLRDLPVGRFNILVMGTDKRPNDAEHYARSDTLLLASIDTISHTVGIMSIPRDLIVDIPGHGKSKVNAAYFFGEYYKEPGGGQALAVRTISKLFNVPIDYYVSLNFEGFRRVIDTVGGVDVNVRYEIDDPQYPSDDEGDLFGSIHIHFNAGWQHMDGKTALRYARTRHADSDFGRSKRQLQLIMAVRKKALSLDLLPALPSLVDQLGGMVETNIPFDQQLGLVQLGYDIDPSKIMTASIDSKMVTTAILPDGSEGLKLNWKVAQPVIDAFFGWDVASSGAGSSSLPEAQPTIGAKSNKPSSRKPPATPSPVQMPTLRSDEAPARTPVLLGGP